MHMLCYVHPFCFTSSLTPLEEQRQEEIVTFVEELWYGNNLLSLGLFANQGRGPSKSVNCFRPAHSQAFSYLILTLAI